jgi:capsular polysaccharide biosynthesis protein
MAPSSADAMADLRNRVTVALGVTARPDARRRFFVRRQSVVRRLVNEAELCEMLVSNWGFEELKPETLGFLEQARCFRQAEIVIGAQGSGLSNATFCAPGASVVTLCTGHAGNFPSWADALRQLGVRHIFAVGRGVPDSHALRHHWDFEVDANVLTEVLGELLGV